MNGRGLPVLITIQFGSCKNLRRTRHLLRHRVPGEGRSTMTSSSHPGPPSPTCPPSARPHHPRPPPNHTSRHPHPHPYPRGSRRNNLRRQLATAAAAAMPYFILKEMPRGRTLKKPARRHHRHRHHAAVATARQSMSLHRTWQRQLGGIMGQWSKSPLATKNLLEDTDGLRRPPSTIHQCPLDAVALCFC